MAGRKPAWLRIDGNPRYFAGTQAKQIEAEKGTVLQETASKRQKRRGRFSVSFFVKRTQLDIQFETL